MCHTLDMHKDILSVEMRIILPIQWTPYNLAPKHAIAHTFWLIFTYYFIACCGLSCLQYLSEVSVVYFTKFNIPIFYL